MAENSANKPSQDSSNKIINPNVFFFKLFFTVAIKSLESGTSAQSAKGGRNGTGAPWPSRPSAKGEDRDRRLFSSEGLASKSAEAVRRTGRAGSGLSSDEDLGLVQVRPHAGGGGEVLDEGVLEVQPPGQIRAASYSLADSGLPRPGGSLGVVAEGYLVGGVVHVAEARRRADDVGLPGSGLPVRARSSGRTRWRTMSPREARRGSPRRLRERRGPVFRRR